MISGSLPDAARAKAGLLFWILRVGVSLCFIGHGAFGIITKAAWVPYFGVAGIGEPWAWRLMPWVGTVDVVIGVLVFLWPCRALFFWATGWAVWTALLRPLSGEPFWEALERAGNYGVPLTVLILCGWKGPMLSRLSVQAGSLTPSIFRNLAWTLRLTTALLLCGHAGLGFFVHKSGLAGHYAVLGLKNSAAWVPLIGVMEFLLAALVLLVPHPSLLVVVCLWKASSESLFLVAGSPIWEWIERFGSYTAPLALAFLVVHSDRLNTPRHRSPPENKPGILYV